METIIDRVGTGVGSFAEFVTTSGATFVIFAGLWVALGASVWSGARAA